MAWYGHPKCPFEDQPSPSLPNHREKVDPASLPVAGMLKKRDPSPSSGPATYFGPEEPDFPKAPAWQPLGRPEGAAGLPRVDQGDLVLG